MQIIGTFGTDVLGRISPAHAPLSDNSIRPRIPPCSTAPHPTSHRRRATYCLSPISDIRTGNTTPRSETRELGGARHPNALRIETSRTRIFHHRRQLPDTVLPTNHAAVIQLLRCRRGDAVRPPSLRSHRPLAPLDFAHHWAIRFNVQIHGAHLVYRTLTRGSATAGTPRESRSTPVTLGR